MIREPKLDAVFVRQKIHRIRRLAYGTPVYDKAVLIQDALFTSSGNLLSDKTWPCMCQGMDDLYAISSHFKANKRYSAYKDTIMLIRHLNPPFVMMERHTMFIPNTP